MTVTESFAQRRRRIVKRAGRRLTKGIADLVVRQSLVADRPVHDTADYPFIAPVEAKWQTIRAEQLRHPTLPINRCCVDNCSIDNPKDRDHRQIKSASLGRG